MKNTDRLIFLMEEIAHLEKQLQPHDTGHIHTAISVLRRRVQEVKSEIDAVPNGKRPFSAWMPQSPDEQKMKADRITSILSEQG